MSGMFRECLKCKYINLFSFNTEKVSNISNMFSGSSFISIDLSSFDTRNITDMSDMFNNCYHLKYVNLSSFKSDKVENMDFMFFWCNNLIKVDFSSFDFDKVNSKNQAFGLSSFDASNEVAYEGPKNQRSIKVNKNSVNEIKKLINSESVKIITV